MSYVTVLVQYNSDDGWEDMSDSESSYDDVTDDVTDEPMEDNNNCEVCCEVTEGSCPIMVIVKDLIRRSIR